jgi:hypothetical protein
MNRSELINQAANIALKQKALWILALTGAVINAVLAYIFTAWDFGAIIRSVLTLVVTAFVSAALISMVNNAAEGQSPSLNDGIQSGIRWFLPVLVIDLLLAIPMWIISFLLTGSFFGAFMTQANQGGVGSASGLFAGLGLSMLVLFVVGILLGAITIGAERSAVLENTGAIDAIKRGWTVFSTHIVDYIVIGLMLFVVLLAVGILMGCAFSIFGLGGFAVGARAGIVAVIIGIVLSAILGAILTVFVSTVWTLAYRKFQGK